MNISLIRRKLTANNSKVFCHDI